MLALGLSGARVGGLEEEQQSSSGARGRLTLPVVEVIGSIGDQYQSDRKRDRRGGKHCDIDRMQKRSSGEDR